MADVLTKVAISNLRSLYESDGETILEQHQLILDSHEELRRRLEEAEVKIQSLLGGAGTIILCTCDAKPYPKGGIAHQLTCALAGKLRRDK